MINQTSLFFQSDSVNQDRFFFQSDPVNHTSLFFQCDSVNQTSLFFSVWFSSNRSCWCVVQSSICDTGNWFFNYRRDPIKDNPGTVTIWISDKSGIQMVQTCLIVGWYSFQMVVWKLDKKCLLQSKMSGNLNGLPNHIFRPFENRTKKCLKSCTFGFWVLSIQMVTIFWFCHEHLDIILKPYSDRECDLIPNS